METNTTSNNVWICKICQKDLLSKTYNYQSHMDRCKAYKNHLKSNRNDDGFKHQLNEICRMNLNCFKVLRKTMLLMLTQTKTLSDLTISR